VSVAINGDVAVGMGRGKCATFSQVKLRITNNAFCIVQRATAQSKAEIVRDYGVAEASPGFQDGWSDCMYFFLSFCSFCLLIWVFNDSHRSELSL
jgi:hypothetical protein